MIDAVEELLRTLEGAGTDVEILRDAIDEAEGRVEDLTETISSLRDDLKEAKSAHDARLGKDGEIKEKADAVIEEMAQALSTLLKAIKEGTAKECPECCRTSRREATIDIEYHALDLIDAAQALESAETFKAMEI